MWNNYCEIIIKKKKSIILIKIYEIINNILIINLYGKITLLK